MQLRAGSKCRSGRQHAEAHTQVPMQTKASWASAWRQGSTCAGSAAQLGSTEAVHSYARPRQGGQQCRKCACRHTCPASAHKPCGQSEQQCCCNDARCSVPRPTRAFFEWPAHVGCRVVAEALARAAHASHVWQYSYDNRALQVPLVG
jgi:hypothetical protein